MGSYPAGHLLSTHLWSEMVLKSPHVLNDGMDIAIEHDLKMCLPFEPHKLLDPEVSTNTQDNHDLLTGGGTGTKWWSALREKDIRVRMLHSTDCRLKVPFYKMSVSV